MIKFYTNWFSPFSRKVALTLDYKAIEYEAVDGLTRINHDALLKLNPRGEVPTICDGSLVISQSSHILAYLDDAYPERPVYPREPTARAVARRLERLFDSQVDAALVNCSLWTWAKRQDQRPEGIIEAAQLEVDAALSEVESALNGRDHKFLFGDDAGIVEFSLWPHLTALRPLGIVLKRTKFPLTGRWYETMREAKLFKMDAARTAAFIQSMTDETHEREKIAWRGDRIEWMLARGYADWFFGEINDGRVIWPLR